MSLSASLVNNLDTSRPISIADNIYWVGLSDNVNDLHCNPYLIVDQDQVILIDAGSRPDFSTVVRKILQVGIKPSQISHLIFQHYDPDLCGSLPNFEDIIDRDDLKILSTEPNNTYIKYYSNRSDFVAIEDLDYKLKLNSGRELKFELTPFAHSAGAFVTHDLSSGILFTSDIYGSLDVHHNHSWQLFLDLENNNPPIKEKINDIKEFHRLNMPSTKALRYALQKVREIDPDMIAPQHGSILYRREDIKLITDSLYEMDSVGIDGLLGDS